MKRKKTPEGNHHKFCAYTYKNGEVRSQWNCTCSLLREYDKWLKRKESK